MKKMLMQMSSSLEILYIEDQKIVNQRKSLFESKENKGKNGWKRIKTRV